MVAYGNCRLWSPTDNGRALLVPAGAGDYEGYFAFRPEQPLKLIQAPLPGDFEAGVRRADARMRRLLASPSLRNMHREGCMLVMHNRGQDIYVETSRLAA